MFSGFAKMKVWRVLNTLNTWRVFVVIHYLLINYTVPKCNYFEKMLSFFSSQVVNLIFYIFIIYVWFYCITLLVLLLWWLWWRKMRILSSHRFLISRRFDDVRGVASMRRDARGGRCGFNADEWWQRGIPELSLGLWTEWTCCSAAQLESEFSLRMRLRWFIS